MVLIDTTIGGKKDIIGVFEETKRFAIPVLDRLGTPIALTGATITFSTSDRVGGAQTIVTGVVSIGTPNNHLVVDLTSLGKKVVNYEIKVVLPSFVFKVWGIINIKDVS